MTFPTCDICGVVSLDVKPGLAEYSEPDGGVRYEARMRCSDHAACQERVRAAGDEWPLLEVIV